VDRHPLDLQPISRCERRAVCPTEAALCLVVIVLVVAVTGPSQVAAGAGGFVGGLIDAVRNVFDAGGFLRPSW
jgi:hypothetical protein